MELQKKMQFRHFNIIETVWLGIERVKKYQDWSGNIVHIEY